MGKASLILVFNCGSSSIKTQVVDPETSDVYFKAVCEEVARKECSLTVAIDGKKQVSEHPGMSYSDAIDMILATMDNGVKSKLKGIGHRVVHGGSHFCSSVVIDDEVEAKIEQASLLAPLHNPYNLLGIEKLRKEFPKLTNVAVFDTAFHTTMPKHAHVYPLNYSLYEDNQIRRYGFHGTSHRYVVLAGAKKLSKEVEQTRFISAHLGGGCSLCASVGGKSVETSMGFSPAEGLMMGTRSGDVDPTLFSFLMDHLKMSSNQVSTLINKGSGLLGVSGLSGDLRVIEKAMDEGDVRAKLAFEIFCYRLAKMIAGYMVAVEEPDALIFTGGIGENSDRVRSRTCALLKPLGIALDERKNSEAIRGCSGDISLGSSAFKILVQPTNEELMIAKDTLERSQS
jgi:acetate kinase